MKLVLASDNAHKLQEFRKLFQTLNVELLSKKETGFTDEVEENGATFEENAYIKAEAVMRATNLPAIADDSGICVDALGGEPGVRSARYTGDHADSDADRYRLVLKNLGDRTDRTARFVCALCCAPAANVRGKSFSRPRARTASAMTRCSSPPASTAPWPSSRWKRKTPSPTGGGHWRYSNRNGRSIRMLTSKQRAQLRGMASTLDTILLIGKDGVTENVIASASEALRARELIKGRVLEASMLTAREACDALASACRAEGVQVIGSKFVLYKRNEKDPKIELVTERKKRK